MDNYKQKAHEYFQAVFDLVDRSDPKRDHALYQAQRDFNHAIFRLEEPQAEYVAPKVNPEEIPSLEEMRGEWPWFFLSMAKECGIYLHIHLTDTGFVAGITDPTFGPGHTANGKKCVEIEGAVRSAWLKWREHCKVKMTTYGQGLTPSEAWS